MLANDYHSVAEVSLPDGNGGLSKGNGVTKAAYFSMIFYDTGIQPALKLTKQTSFYN